MANLRNNETGAYPISVEQFKASFPQKSFPENIDFESFGYSEVLQTTAPSVTGAQTIIEGIPTFDSAQNKWVQTWVVTSVTAGMDATTATNFTNDMRARLVSDLANYRFNVETSGITLQGQPIPTDRLSQYNLSSAVSVFALNPTGTIAWSTSGNTFVTLTFPQIQAMAISVFNYVQQCRAHEQSIFNSYQAASTPDELVAINITQGWPTNTF